MGLDDGKNLNREFPGNPDGTEMERLAWAVSQELQPAADYYIDLHSGDDYEKLIPYVYYAGAAAGEVVSLFETDGRTGGRTLYGKIKRGIRRFL